MNKESAIYNLLRSAAIIGNVVFVLWVLYNGMDEGWSATPVQMFVCIALILLLALNAILLWRKR